MSEAAQRADRRDGPTRGPEGESAILIVVGTVSLRLHGDLNDFLPPRVRDHELRRSVVGRPGAKDLLEAVGVPHPEVGRLTINGHPASLSDRVGDGDRVEAWPWEGVGAFPDRPDGVPPKASRADREGHGIALVQQPRFVLDGHLGRLAAYLRMLGFDAWYRRDADDRELAALAAEGRILLTRDRDLLKRSAVRLGAYLRSDRPTDQILEVVRRFAPPETWQPFGRCLRCNARLEPVAKARILHRLPPLTRILYDEFRRCPNCDALYWSGSHHVRMSRFIEDLRAAAQSGGEVGTGGSAG